MVVQSIVEKSGLKTTDTILEIGPGTGNLTLKLLERVKKVVAVEVDPRMVSHCLTCQKASMPKLINPIKVCFTEQEQSISRQKT